MFRNLTTKALVVLGMSAAGILLTSREAEAYFFCDTWYAGPCQGWDQEESEIACNGACPGWYAMLCDPVTGKFQCVDDPT